MAVRKQIVNCALATFMLGSTTCILQGCGDPWSSEKLLALVDLTQHQCSVKCSSSSLYGRWNHGRPVEKGFMCWDAQKNTAECRCASERPVDCKPITQQDEDDEVVDPVGSLMAVTQEAVPAGRAGPRQSVQFRLDADGVTAVTPASTPAPAPGTAVLQVVSESSAQVASGTKGSPSQTVQSFCDATGLAEMHGKKASEDLEEEDSIRDLESKIIGDVARELETNNVDKMAKEIFSFYVCVRWAPDDVFWQLAEQELAAQIAEKTLSDEDKAVTDEKITALPIAEMYQKYQFVPMLCSRNLEVFHETDDVDKTYFRKFRAEVKSLTEWLKMEQAGQVAESLAKIDRTFCGNQPMNSCKRSEVVETIKSWFGFGKTEKEAIAELVREIRSFGSSTDEAFKADFARWKGRFPYHSFIAKPSGWEGDVQDSPTANERFVVCFGKRVASELHRRPNGQHILTDQNNIGCHGWYEVGTAAEQLDRIVEMWKPPTCQLAEMSYNMKKQILAKFQEMNERLFDSLPSIINDELQAEELDGEFRFEEHLPRPFDPKEVSEGSRTFVDGMRVGSRGRICLEHKPKENVGDWDECKEGFLVEDSSYGTVEVVNSKVQVLWEGMGKVRKSYPVPLDRLKVMPFGWKAKRGFHGHFTDLVAGVSHITDKARQFFNAMFSTKQKNLANLMSGSVSKWAVCPIQADADLTELDSHLGVEDAAFQDFQKEGYKKWTGFEAAIPGETCVDAAKILPSVKGFEKSKACEINELHADHVEKYTRGDKYEKEDFVCPLQPPLPADEQLTILMEKKDTCFLRMTGKQEQHYEWHYQGHFPARRQNDRKANNPRTEFELIKLMKVSEGGVDGDVSLGRFCSLDELQDNPRFCNLATVHNLHMSVGEFADNLAKSLTAAGEALRDGGPIAAGTVVAPLGVGATAVSDSVAKYQAEKKALFDSEKEGKEIAKDVAVAVSEKTWDNLRGAGRLLHSTAKHAVSKVMPSPPGTSRIITELDERYFANNKTGDVLFSLSFQKSIGSRWFSVRNAKERFTRYVVSHPCPGFDPAFHFSMRRRWSEVVLRMVRSAWLVHNKSPRPNAILEAPSLHLALRGEALRFETQREHTTDEFYRPFASMLRKTSVDSNASAFKCTLTKDEQRCDPDNMCELVKDAGGKIGDLFGFGNLGYRYCKPKVWARAVSGSWWHISDAELRAVVAPAFTTGQGLALSKLRGLEMDLYCATKGELRAGGAPQLPADAPSLESCLTRGIEKNAVMKAREPWKLYFPDEVVVVARFKELTQRFCKPSEHSTLAAESKAGACGNGAVAMEQLDQHVKVSGRLVEDLRESGRTYMGLHTGAGWPSSTLEEVVLQPQDVLETLGLISKSNGR